MEDLLYMPVSRRDALHTHVYFGGLMLLAIGLPSSVFLMSLAQIIIVVNWLARGNLKGKIRLFASNRAAMVFASIYLVHVLALFYSSNLADDISTLKSRLPVLLLTLVVATSPPLYPGTKKWLPMAFAGSISVVSLFSLSVLFKGEYTDYRELSPFISHIRMSLMVALSVVLLFWQGRYDFARYPVWQRICLALAAWHLLYLFLLQSMSGVGVFLLVVAVFLIRKFLYGKARWRFAALAAMSVSFLGVLLLFFVLWKHVNQEVDTDLSALDRLTSMGAEYLHDRQAPVRENGHLVYIYIAEEEIRDAWNHLSKIDFDATDPRGQPLRDVLYRYLSSRGLRKDAEALGQLTQEEIRAVEQGVTNTHYRRWPWLIVRIHQSLWELKQYGVGGNPEGHSLAQRLEFWQAGLRAAAEKPLFGWGTGDVRVASAFGLEQIGSALEFERWMKPHNQYLSFAVQFGLAGFFWIVLAMVYPPLKLGKFRRPDFLAFFVIFMASMLAEDTIDTQAGLTFFVFFFNYFLFLRESRAESHFAR